MTDVEQVERALDARGVRHWRSPFGHEVAWDERGVRWAFHGREPSRPAQLVACDVTPERALAISGGEVTP